MASDLEIARAASMEPIEAVAWKLGISAHELTPMGNGVAKINWRALKERFSKPQGSLVLVTSVNPHAVWRRQDGHHHRPHSGAVRHRPVRHLCDS